ncbi:Hypothetical protein SMAX5B_001737 [Scophthalmus maximus]|uniref:Uncharacterized protein n=1 Tax=Scophthalmus maximus TaxID=52904 RepID=A0A2U9CY23_SCOMX|nr:Hypothetical protein SMAX5B_001737 [Scophthalmus maximus]
MCAYFAPMKASLFTAPPEAVSCSYLTVFRCHTVANRGEGALASCLDMELQNVVQAACGSGGLDVYTRVWSLDKEADSCYFDVGWRAEKGVGPQEAQGGHMPNSPGGQSCPALCLTSLLAPPSPVRYMCVWSKGCRSGDDTPPLF